MTKEERAFLLEAREALEGLSERLKSLIERAKAEGREDLREELEAMAKETGLQLEIVEEGIGE